MHTNFIIVLASLVGLIAAVWDLKYRLIPNWLTFPAMILGIILNLLINTNHWWYSFLGLLVGLAILFIPFALGGMGAGDLKLLMALGTILGPKATLWTALFGGIAGGLIALVIMFYKQGWSKSWLQIFLLITSLWNRSNRKIVFNTSDPLSKIYIPYAVAIFLGLIASLIIKFE